MHIKINIEIFKVLKFDFEASSSGKTKEEKLDDKKEPPAPSTPSYEPSRNYDSTPSYDSGSSSSSSDSSSSSSGSSE